MFPYDIDALALTAITNSASYPCKRNYAIRVLK